MTAIRLFIFLLVLSFLGVSTPAFGEFECSHGIEINIEKNKTFKDLLKWSVFQVILVSNGPSRKEETIGTATLISNDGHLLTAAHIFEIDNNRILKGIEKNEFHLLLKIPLDGSKPLTYKSTSIKRLSKKYDLMVIKLTDWKEKKEVKPVWLDVKSDPTDYRTRLMGYITNKNKQEISDVGNIQRISEKDGYLRASGLYAYQGFSGSLLVTRTSMAVAVLSGKFKTIDDDNIEWAEIGDMENGVLNAVPLNAVIDELATLNLKKADEFMRRLNQSSDTISDLELRTIIESDRLAAIELAIRLRDLGSERMIGLENRDNAFKLIAMISCLMPSEIAINGVFKIANYVRDAEERDRKNNKINRNVQNNFQELANTKADQYSSDNQAFKKQTEIKLRLRGLQN